MIESSAAGDANAEQDIYDDDAVCDYLQSGKRILGRSNLQALRSHHPGKPSGSNVKRILGEGDLWITEYKGGESRLAARSLGSNASHEINASNEI